MSGAMLVAALAGCAPNTGGEANNNSQTQGVEISWGIAKPKSETDMKAYETVVENYNKENTKNVTVKINYVEYTDDAQYNTWLSSQLMGGVAPEVVGTWYTPAVENYRKGLVRDLSPELAEKNPYSGSEEAWQDLYSEGLLNQSMDNLSNAIPSVPLSTVAVKIFYNKTLFEQAGIDEIPETFTEFMDLCQNLQDQGIVPFIVPNQSAADNVFNWLHRMFMDQMIDGLVGDIDTSGNEQVELNEICAAFDKGQIDLTKEPWNAPLPLIKEFSQYWYPGYNGLDTATVNDLFMRGEGAMVMNTGPTLKTFLDNPDIDFEIGYFTFPYLTKEDSPLACEKIYEMGGAPQSSQCIPAAVTGEKLEAAMDFLQYLSSEKAAAVFAEQLWWVPPFKEVSGMPEVMKDMYIEGATSKLRLLAPQTDQLLYQDDTKLGQLYLEDQITAEEFNATLQKDLEDSVTQLKETNGWSSENNWGAAQEN